MASVLDINRVRLLIADTGTDRVLDDMQLDTYLELNGQNVRLAAAEALESIAVSELLVSKVIRTQDLATDGAKVAAELRALAQRLRDRVALDDRYDGFDPHDPRRVERPARGGVAHELQCRGHDRHPPGRRHLRPRHR